MKYTVEKKEEYAILTLLEDNLNSLKAPELKSELIVQKNAGIKHLILNLEHVKYIDSSGLSAILTGNRLWMEDETLFILASVTHPSVKMLISISRLDSILNIYDSVADAEKFVMMQEFKEVLQSDGDKNKEQED